eukprot:1451027-Amphidinium_carterae.2
MSASWNGRRHSLLPNCDKDVCWISWVPSRRSLGRPLLSASVPTSATSMPSAGAGPSAGETPTTIVLQSIIQVPSSAELTGAAMPEIMYYSAAEVESACPEVPSEN